MKSLFYFLRKIWFTLIGIFSPKSGLVPASIELNRAIADARLKNRKTGRRYYTIWDQVNRRLINLTYKGYPGRTDSYQYMRMRGGFPPCTLETFKESAYYYTSSKNGALEMPAEEINKRLQLLRSRHYQRKENNTGK